MIERFEYYWGDSGMTLQKDGTYVKYNDHKVEMHKAFEAGRKQGHQGGLDEAKRAEEYWRNH